MHRAWDSNNLREALNYSFLMLSELRTSRLSPHKYFELCQSSSSIHPIICSNSIVFCILNILLDVFVCCFLIRQICEHLTNRGNSRCFSFSRTKASMVVQSLIYMNSFNMLETYCPDCIYVVQWDQCILNQKKLLLRMYQRTWLKHVVGFNILSMDCF